MITSITENNIDNFINDVYLPIEKLYYHGFDCHGPSVLVSDMFNKMGKDKDVYIELPLAGYCTLSGGIIERANYQYIIEKHDQRGGELPPYITGYGAHDTHALYFNLTQATLNQYDNLFILINDLTNTPCISDDYYTAIEGALISDYIWCDLTREVLDNIPTYIIEYLLSRKKSIPQIIQELYMLGKINFQFDNTQVICDQEPGVIAKLIFIHTLSM